MLKRYLQYFISLALLSLVFPLNGVLAEPVSGKVVINEIQTGGDGTGTTGQEFIELTNIGAESVDLTGYKLQYTPSTGNLASTKNFVTFNSGTIIYPNGYLLISPSDYLTTVSPKITYEINSSFSGLSGSGATISLVDSIGVLLDRVGYGTTATIIKEGDLTSAPSGGKSIERLVVNGIVQDSDNNKNDFVVNDIVTPLTTNNAPIVDLEEPISEPITDPGVPIVIEEIITTEATDVIDSTVTAESETISEETPPATNTESKVYQPILLNELFIDPETPLTDANDEWVELYNPNDTAVDISGYTLYAGTNYTYRYTFFEGSSIAPRGYLSVTSGNTPIALANSGGTVKIVSPNSEIFDQVTYDKSEAGQTWAKDALGIWQWTTTPSQDSQNVITVVAVDPIKAAAASLAATKKPKATDSTAATTKPKMVAAAKPKATPKPKSSSNNSGTIPGLIDAPMPIPAWLLAVFGGLAILYAVYEYRFEASNKFFQFQQYRANRRANRSPTSWWRSNSSRE